MKVWVVTAIPPFTYQHRFVYAVTYTERDARLKRGELEQRLCYDVEITEHEVI